MRKAWNCSVGELSVVASTQVEAKSHQNKNDQNNELHQSPRIGQCFITTIILLSLFLGSNETATTPQSIRNNNHKTMMIMTTTPDSAVWLHQFVPFHSSVFVWFRGEPNEKREMRHILPNVC